jgi:DNA-binding IclR family transcriptional regulator
MSQQSIQRATQVLGLFTFERPNWRVSDVAKALNLAIGTAHGIISALEKADYIEQDPSTKEYHLGLKLLELGALQSATFSLNRKAASPISYLSRHTSTIGRVGVLTNDVVLTTMSTDHQEWHPSSYIGPTVPAFCTGIGRAILAYLPGEQVIAHLARVKLHAYTPKTLTDPVKLRQELAATKERGYSLVYGETLIHLDTIGAPVFGPEGKIVGAVSLSGAPSQFAEGDIVALAPKLLDAAMEISTHMGYRPQPHFV